MRPRADFSFTVTPDTTGVPPSQSRSVLDVSGYEGFSSDLCSTKRRMIGNVAPLLRRPVGGGDQSDPGGPQAEGDEHHAEGGDEEGEADDLQGDVHQMVTTFPSSGTNTDAASVTATSGEMSVSP